MYIEQWILIFECFELASPITFSTNATGALAHYTINLEIK